MTEDPHIVVLCIDTLRKDVYDERVTRLGKKATVSFEEMRAPSAWSVPSHAGMFTGHLPSSSGLHAYNRDFSTIDRSDTFLSGLDGYETVAVSANVYASDSFGFDGLFDEFVRFSPSSRFSEGMDVQRHLEERGPDEGYVSFLREAISHPHPGLSVLNGLLLKLRDVGDKLPVRNVFDYGAQSITRTVRNRIRGAEKPTFVFANIMDVHGPHAPFYGLDRDQYDVSPSFNSRQYDNWWLSFSDDPEAQRVIDEYRELYAAEAAYVDRVIASMVEDLRSETDRPIRFVVTADHGENLGYEADDGLMTHQGSLSEALLHVPFDVISDAHEGVVEGYTTLLDLGDVVNCLRTGAALDQVTREHVAAEIAGCGSDLPEDEPRKWDRAQRAVYDGNRKHVRFQGGEGRVYDVSNGPSWQANVDEPVDDSLFAEWFETPLDAWAEAAEREASSTSVDDAVRGRLEELGYM